MNKRQLQKEETKEKIMQTAISVYALKGFSAPTSEIAKEAGVSHGTVFSHFPTVEALLVEILEKFNTSIVLELHNKASQNSSLEELLYKYLEVLEEYESFYKRLITETKILPKEVRFTLIEIQSAISHHFSQIVEKDKKKGLIKEIPQHILFNTWLGLVHYYIQNTQMFAPNGSVIKRYKKEWITNYLLLIKR